ncbi:MAG: 3-methyl-2-oxobutanoate hydroxymethyltransferase, partial [Boseongicola sp.]|nr:3-methyl-2-oxobutanoate hydroxymethyltransferase [Boseongicola sp.]
NSRPPKFVKVYGDLANQIESAVKNYAEDVRDRKFPTEDQVYR